MSTTDQATLDDTRDNGFNVLSHFEDYITVSRNYRMDIPFPGDTCYLHITPTDDGGLKFVASRYTEIGQARHTERNKLVVLEFNFNSKGEPIKPEVEYSYEVTPEAKLVVNGKDADLGHDGNNLCKSVNQALGSYISQELGRDYRLVRFKKEHMEKMFSIIEPAMNHQVEKERYKDKQPQQEERTPGALLKAAVQRVMDIGLVQRQGAQERAGG